MVKIKMTWGKRGFTLIELIVVMAIIAILAGIAITNSFNSFPKARDAQRKNDLKQMQTALQVYFQDNSTYPPDSPCSSSDPNLCWMKLFGDPPNTTYIKQMPQDPGSNVYTYCRIDTDKYVLVANLEIPHDADINRNDNGCATSVLNPYWLTNP